MQCNTIASPPQSPSFMQPVFSAGTTILWTISTTERSRPATKYQVDCSNDVYHSRTITPATNTTLYDLRPCDLYTCCVGGIDTNGAIGTVNCTSFRTPFTPIRGIFTTTILNFLKPPQSIYI